MIGQYFTNSIVDTIVLSFTVEWKPKFLFSISAAKKLMSYGWKILAADLVGTVYQQLRSFIIGKVYTSSDLAYYNQGKKFPDLITTNVDGTISTVLFPAMSNYSDDKERVGKMVSRAMRVSSFVIFPLMIGLAAISKPLVIIMLTDKWLPAVPFMQIMCISGAINSVTNANLQAMKAIGRSDIVLKLEFAKKPVGLLMIVVTMNISVTAIAWTMPVYAIYAAAVNMKPNKNLIGYGLKRQIKDLIPATFYSLAMCFAIKVVSLVELPILFSLILQVMTGAGVYLALAYFTKADAFQYIVGYGKDLIKRKI